MLSFDHIVIAAPTLSEGADYVRDLTGIDMPKGGEHPLMGTHNCLLRLGTDEFLEVIAVNPDAPAPSRPRWFGLDQPVQHPHLAHWVVRCTDMAATRPHLPDLLGPAIPLTRGDLRWLLTVPEDGALPMQGAMPSLIDWQTEALPPTKMTGAGAVLETLAISHPDAAQIRDSLPLTDPRITYVTGPLSLTAQIRIGDRLVTLR